MRTIDRQLIEVCQNGDTLTVKQLLQQGANPNTRDPWGQTLFLIAAQKGDINMLRLLIEHGADPCLADPFDITALHRAVEKGHHDIVAYLLSQLKLDPNIQDKRRVTPLMIVAQNGDMKMLHILSQYGANPCLADSFGRTALHHAIKRNHRNIAEFLITQLQTDPNTQDRDGITPLMIATQNSDIDMLKILIRLGANPHLNDIVGQNALHYAVKKRNHEAAQYLITQLKLDPNTQDQWGRTPLMIAAQKGDIDMIHLLIQHGANPHLNDIVEQTALHHAVETRRHQTTEYLITELKLDPNTQDHEGKTPFLIAAKNGDIPMLRLLIQHGADSTITDDDQRTALHHAVGQGCHETAQYLLTQLHLDPNAEDHDGTTPFMIASSKGDIPMLRLLTQLGANPHATDHQGRNALHYAAKYGDSQTVLRLITHHHLDPNQQDHDGNTPLHIALQNDHVYTAKTFIQLGAHPHIPNRQGEKTITIARKQRAPITKPQLSAITL